MLNLAKSTPPPTYQLLYKQKFFNFVIPKVEQGFAVAKGAFGVSPLCSILATNG